MHSLHSRRRVEPRRGDCARRRTAALVHVAPDTSGVPHVFPCPKSPEFVPVMDTLLMVKEAVPLLVTVTLWAPLEAPVVTVPKSMLDRLSVAIGNAPLRGATISAW